MMVRLVNDPDAVGVLAARVADEIGLPAEQVEKDFWVTEVLRGVTRSAGELGIEVVFKGGTSLSKAFRLIERFSEDVDVLVILPQREPAQRSASSSRWSPELPMQRGCNPSPSAPLPRKASSAAHASTIERHRSPSRPAYRTVSS